MVHFSEWFVQVAHAQSPVPLNPVNVGSGGINPMTLVNNLTGNVMQLLLLIGGALAVVFLTWAGLQYITSAGNPEKAKVARGNITNAIIGIVVIIATYFIINVAIGIGNYVSNSYKAPTSSTNNGSNSGNSSNNNNGNGSANNNNGNGSANNNNGSGNSSNNNNGSVIPQPEAGNNQVNSNDDDMSNLPQPAGSNSGERTSPND